MAFQSMNLPYESGALEPYISAKTMSFHHDKHYKKYVATLNELTAKSSIAVGNLEETMLRSPTSTMLFFKMRHKYGTMNSFGNV